MQVDQKRCQVNLSLREPSAASEKLEAGALVNGQIIHVSGTFAICLFLIVSPCLEDCAAQMQR